MNRPKPLLGPSILNSDLSNLSFECKDLLENGADYIHLDVMDGNFVPNLTFGHPVVKCLRSHIKEAFFDMHMMVSNPEKWVNDMADAGGTQYTFHIEATSTPGECIRLIRESGMKVGLAISPKTPVETLEPYVKDIDMALVMTVEPGKGGQKFMSEMMSKVEYLRKNFEYLNVSVDGGVGPSNLDVCLKHGANMIVSGTAITNSKNRREAIDSMKKIMESHF